MAKGVSKENMGGSERVLCLVIVCSVLKEGCGGSKFFFFFFFLGGKIIVIRFDRVLGDVGW